MSFFGHLWNSTGISPDPDKIDSILRMDFPQDKETMHSFLGLVNFLNRYSAELVQHSSALRNLLDKNTTYKITEEHREAFRNIKKIFSTKITLPYFSQNRESVLQVDASKKGLGATLIQNETPIYYASRTLSNAEKNYQNLERECLAAVWGMEKFHYYLYGKHFTLQTDQKPLVSIFKKHMVDVSPRIQRLAIRCWNYDFTPEWIPGKNNSIADALSRVSPLEIKDSDKEGGILSVNILSTSQISQPELEELLAAYGQDPKMQALKRVISEGWPSKRSNCSSEIADFWNYRDEISIEDGILLKNTKIIVPKILQKKYLEKIHSGHQGINACLARAREYVFWIGYSNDIKETVEKCEICQENDTTRRIQHKYVSDVPPIPWHTVGSDLFYYRKNDFLVLVDYFSKFFLTRRIPSSTTAAVKQEFQEIFQEYGIPFILRSDNGPCYASREMKTFLDESGIIHSTSSPHYPQSNGLAEAFVKISKNLMEKAVKEGKKWNTYLLQHRVTPLSKEIPSPYEILFGRKPRSDLTLLPSQLMNSRISRIREEIARKEGKYHAIENTSGELPIEIGQQIWHQDPQTKKWSSGLVEKACDEPNSFVISTKTGARYRRNRNFIKPRQVGQKSDSSSNLPGTISSGVSASGHAMPTTHTHTDAMPVVPPTPKVDSSPKKSSTPGTRRFSARSTKGIAPERLEYK